MDRKILGIGIGVVLAISLLAVAGFAFAQRDRVNAPEWAEFEESGCHRNGECFVDAEGDGACDNRDSCPKHQNKLGCAGSCGRHAWNGECQRLNR